MKDIIAAMKNLAGLGVLLGASASLTGCAAAAPVAPALVVGIQREGEGCLITVDGQRVTSDQLMAIGRSSRSRRAVLVGDKYAPYKCIGATIITLQQAGFREIDSSIQERR